MYFLLQLRSDSLGAAHDGVEVPPLPPLAGDGHGDQDGVDGNRSGGGEKGDPGQGSDQESQGVGSGSPALSLCCN